MFAASFQTSVLFLSVGAKDPQCHMINPNTSPHRKEINYASACIFKVTNSSQSGGDAASSPSERQETRFKRRAPSVKRDQPIRRRRAQRFLHYVAQTAN